MEGGFKKIDEGIIVNEEKLSTNEAQKALEILRNPEGNNGDGAFWEETKTINPEKVAQAEKAMESGLHKNEYFKEFIINEAESRIERARTENYGLKMKLERAKSQEEIDEITKQMAKKTNEINTLIKISAEEQAGIKNIDHLLDHKDDNKRVLED